MSTDGSKPAIYEVCLAASITNLPITLYVVAKSIDDALRTTNKFMDGYPWRGDRPDVASIGIAHTPDYVLISRQLIDRSDNV